MPDRWAPPVGAPAVEATVVETLAAEKRSLVGVVRFGIGMVAAAVLMIVAALALAATLLPFLVGWSAVSISSGSMEPAFGPGDVLLAKPHEGQLLRPGSVLVVDDPVGTGLVSHRLVSVNDDGTLTTKGDANRTADSAPVELDEVVGVVRASVPAVGWPTLWIGSGDIRALFLTGMLGFGLLVAARWGMSSRFDPWTSRPSPTPVGTPDRPHHGPIVSGSDVR